MERNTIQIQHMKFRISNLQKFDLTGFCLPFFFIGRPCVEPEFVPSRNFGPCRTSTVYFNAFFLRSRRGHQLMDFKCPAWSKIEGRQSIFNIEIY